MWPRRAQCQPQCLRESPATSFSWGLPATAAALYTRVALCKHRRAPIIRRGAPPPDPRGPRAAQASASRQRGGEHLADGPHLPGGEARIDRRDDLLRTAYEIADARLRAHEQGE